MHSFLMWKDRQSVICLVAIIFYIIFLFILANLAGQKPIPYNSVVSMGPRDSKENFQEDNTVISQMDFQPFYTTQVPKIFGIPTNPEDYVFCYDTLLPVYILKMDFDETNTLFLQDSIPKNEIIYETDMNAKNYIFNPTSVEYNRVCNIFFSFHRKY